ncbi:protein LTV1 homolog isoform X2 [Durio zibethinus]|uniref:Protein LTV1 homolog isoform X1 n=1 Tax=Durio zibethinus TaxID=66656 RepID=A0A6P5X974_DURZI|nr:protein LTV1 homolog isoform X1 [Durio zibethinus]XP_022724372.1 protein LTV1 homolog isoform X2 [Durio zibethinus]
MGKKKFIDKKKAATFQLLARDSSDPNYSNAPGSDRVFVRVDNNPVSVHTVLDEDNRCYNDSQYDEEDSIFADAPDDDDNGGDDYDSVLGNSSRKASNEKGALPEKVRKEILELGFPDDGYNYLIHLREIRNTGGGSAFYHNPKFKPDQLPRDIKAYDASRVQILKSKGDYNEKSIYSVASKTLNARMQKVVDPEVAALLDDSDLSRFGSDVEDLEEDFVLRANTAEAGESDETDKKLDFVEKSDVIIDGVKKAGSDSGNQEIANEVRNYQVEKPHARSLLDEQFDILEQQEYGTDDDEYEGYIAEQEEFLADKLKNVLNENDMDDLELDDKYKAPADLLHGSESLKCKELLASAADIMRRCAEYAEKYENESEDEKVLVVQESSDESEKFDCESIISTYSTLDNHPGKIEAPEVARKKKLAETVSGVLCAKSQVISLRGKEKLPVDFLPNSRKVATEKVKVAGSLKPEQFKRKQHGQENKEEKKERKVAVKRERSEARRMKKATKELYRSEAQQAQKVAALAGPSSIRLM